ncbi:MAG: Maf family protein [Eubacteriales bacterium]
MGKTLYLASSSPRRREILTRLGFPFRLLLPDGEEDCAIREPAALVRTLGERKARSAFAKLTEAERRDALILACDTVVSVGEEILGKPKDRNDARRMLHLLSGREHEVYSGIAVMTEKKLVAREECTRVRFARLTDREIDAYLATGEPDDKAGAYAVQGIGALWIEGIEGCYFNVMGLPVRRVYTVLREEFGVDPFSLQKRNDSAE